MPIISAIVNSLGDTVMEPDRTFDLVNQIIKYFADKKLTYDEAKCILQQVEARLGDCSFVNSITLQGTN